MLIRLTAEQVKAIEEKRASERPIPSIAEVIRRALDSYLKEK